MPPLWSVLLPKGGVRPGGRGASVVRFPRVAVVAAAVVLGSPGVSLASSLKAPGQVSATVTGAHSAPSRGTAAASAPAASATAHGPQSALDTHGATYPLTSTMRVQLLPATVFYRRYLADPRQMMMKAAALHVLKTGIPDTESPLLEFTLGGWVPLLRLHPKDDPELGLQISAGAAFIARFDVNANFDAIGWDGYYSLRFSYRPIRSLVLKLAEQHDSAHVADEYIRKTDRKRLTYTREEVAFGAQYALPVALPVRVYAEAGYAIHLGNKHLERWRLQQGLEAEWRMSYVAVDATYWQEDGWRPTMTAQLGIKAEHRATGRRRGVALQFENGRTLLGEFYQARNRTLGAVFWADL